MNGKRITWKKNMQHEEKCEHYSKTELRETGHDDTD
jgi:hypothetical protein